MLKYTQLIVFILLFAPLLHSQQVSLYSADKVGIGLNCDKTFSPEIIFKAERHSFLTQYWMFYPAIGCKIRYYKAERGCIYTGGYVSAALAYNTVSGEWLHHFVPDIHLCGIEIYPFNKDYLGVSIYMRSLNFESYRGHSALLIRF